LTGAVASENVTEAFKGLLRAVGNRSQSVKVQGGFTARQTRRAVAKAGLSDPVVDCGIAIAQRIKATLGITGLSLPRVHIDGEVWHLDVGSSHPWYVSWVQNVVRQFGPYPSRALDTCEILLLVREDQSGRTYGVSVVAPAALPTSCVRTG